MTPHGTINRYKRYGCRCGICRAVNAKYSRESSKRWRKKQIGSCSVCGSATRYNGRGVRTSTICIRCTRSSQKWPRWAVEHLASLYRSGLSSYSIAERVAPSLGPSVASAIRAHLARSGVQMRPRYSRPPVIGADES